MLTVGGRGGDSGGLLTPPITPYGGSFFLIILIEKIFNTFYIFSFTCSGFLLSSWIHRYDLSDRTPFINKDISKNIEGNGNPLIKRDISEDIMECTLLCNIFWRGKPIENKLLYTRQSNFSDFLMIKKHKTKKQKQKQKKKKKQIQKKIISLLFGRIYRQKETLENCH